MKLKYYHVINKAVQVLTIGAFAHLAIYKNALSLLSFVLLLIAAAVNAKACVYYQEGNKSEGN